MSARVEIIGRQTNAMAPPLPASLSDWPRADAPDAGVSTAAAAEVLMNVRRCIWSLDPDMAACVGALAAVSHHANQKYSSNCVSFSMLDRLRHPSCLFRP